MRDPNPSTPACDGDGSALLVAFSVESVRAQAPASPPDLCHAHLWSRRFWAAAHELLILVDGRAEIIGSMQGIKTP